MKNDKGDAMIRNRFLISILLVFVLLFYVFNDSYVALLLLILTISLFTFSCILVLFVRKKVQLTIENKRSIYNNQNGLFTLHVKNNSLFPVTKVKFGLRIHNVLTNEQYSDHFYTALNGKESKSIPIQLKSKYVGKIIFTVENRTVYDVFGIVGSSKQLMKQEELYVLPYPNDINILLDTWMTDFHEDFLQIEEKGFDHLDVIGLKEYEVGHNVKHIHWKLSSKLDHLLVKEMSNPKDSSYYILLETSVENMEAKEINEMIESTYSLSRALLEQNQAHYISWLDYDINDLKVEKVISLDQLNHLLRKMLVMTFKVKGETSIHAFSRHKDSLQLSHLIYITSLQRAESNLEHLHHIKWNIIHCSLGKTDDATTSA